MHTAYAAASIDTNEQEAKLCAELERRKREMVTEERIVHKIRAESNELRDLEVKLRAGYMNKERQVQIAEKTQLAAKEAALQQALDNEMEARRIRFVDPNLVGMQAHAMCMAGPTWRRRPKVMHDETTTSKRGWCSRTRSLRPTCRSRPHMTSSSRRRSIPRPYIVDEMRCVLEEDGAEKLARCGPDSGMPIRSRSTGTCGV